MRSILSAKHIPSFLLALSIALPVYATTYLDEDYETGQTAGAQPVGATRVRPTPNTSSNFVKVVSEAQNTAGGGFGNGVQLYDNDANPSALEYDVIGSGAAGLSQFQVSFDFAYVSGSGTDQIYLGGGMRGEALTSSSRRWFSSNFGANGTVEGVDVSDGLQHHMDVFVNDAEEESLEYIGPQGAGTLPTNSVAFFVDGVLVTEEQLAGAVFGTSNNFGRVGFNTYTAATDISYTFDNLEVADVTESNPANSSGLVYSGTNGLEYAGYANEGQDNAVNTVPDFSNAGYRGGGVSIPFVPTAVSVTNGPGDDTVLIQDAIDTVSALPMGTHGFRGAVLLRAGDYSVSSTLVIDTSGIVLRGEGSQDSGGTRITYTAATQSNLFEIDNGGSGPGELVGTRQRIMDAYVPVGAKSFTVADAAGVAVGDRIMIQNTMNQQWIDDLSNMGQWGWTAAGYQLTFRRTITAIDGDRITMNAPIVQAIESQYGGGELYIVTFADELENIGFEGLRMESTFAHDADEQHGWNAIVARRLKNGWVRQVTARYFGYGLVNLLSNCQQITVEDCAMLDPKSITTGGRKYSFNIDDSDCILMQRCFTRGGRHDFASGSRTPGPNVFVDCRANETYSDIGPHHRYSTGHLYDNIKGGEVHVQNREDSGSGHGWAGAQIMFWNCDTSSMICDAPTGGMNWCVGSLGNKNEGSWAPEEPFGIWDSHNSPVVPRSLYYAQLAERLDTYALHNVILPEQEAGGIWPQLDSWGGEGRFLNPLVVWIEEEFPPVASPVPIRGMIRDLNMLEQGFSSLWSNVSGPGTVSFFDGTAVETLATFSQPGSYVLQWMIDDGLTIVTEMLHVQVQSAPDADALYNAWLELYPSLGSFTNLTDDVEPDGMNNLLEYALNGNPTRNDAMGILPVSQRVSESGSNGLHYRYQRRSDAPARGLTYSVLTGYDLVKDSMTNTVPPFSISPATNGFETTTHRIPTDPATNGFMGLIIEIAD